MPPTFHHFMLKSEFTPAHVLGVLNKIKEHPSQRDDVTSFEFDWIARRLEISANSAEGAARCVELFQQQIEKLGGDRDVFLIGKVQESEGRFKHPIGITMHDPATFGEMIGKSLVDIGVRGIKVIDRMDHCLMTIQIGMFTGAVDYASFINEFPLPSYITLSDEGLKEPTAEDLAATRAAHQARRKAEKKKKKKR